MIAEPQYRDNDIPTPLVLGERGRLVHVYESGEIERDWDSRDGEPCTTKCGRKSWHAYLANVRDQQSIRHCAKCGLIPLSDFCCRCGTRFLVSALDDSDPHGICAYCAEYLDQFRSQP